MRLHARILLSLALLLLPFVATAARPDLTVMSYNTMQLPVQDWDQANRRQRLPAAIRALSPLPDVIVFEEIFTDAAYDRLVSLKDVYPYRTPNVGQVCSGGGWTSISGDCSNAGTVIRGGVVVLSRWPIIEQHALVYRNSRFGTWDYQSNKGVAYVRIRKQATTTTSPAPTCRPAIPKSPVPVETTAPTTRCGWRSWKRCATGSTASASPRATR